MKTLNKGNYSVKLCESIEDLNICRMIELGVFDKRGIGYPEQFALLVYELNESITEVSFSLLQEKLDRIKKAGYFGLNSGQVVDTFAQNARKIMKKVFPTDFNETDFALSLYKQMLMLRCDAVQVLNFFNVDIEEEVRQVEERLHLEMGAQEKASVLEMYRSFEEMCFTMSQMDGIMTVPQLKALTAYEFYTHKENLKKKNGKSGNHTV